VQSRNLPSFPVPTDPTPEESFRHLLHQSHACPVRLPRRNNRQILHPIQLLACLRQITFQSFFDNFNKTIIIIT